MIRDLGKAQFVRTVYYSQDSKKRRPMFIIEDVFDCFIDCLEKAMLEGEHVYLRGFGTFHPLRSCFTLVDGAWHNGKKKHEQMLHFHSDKAFRGSPQLYEKVNRGGRDVYTTYFNDSTNS